MSKQYCKSLLVLSVAVFATTAMLAQDNHQLPANFLSRSHIHFTAEKPHGRHGAQQSQTLQGEAQSHGIPAIDSLSNWNGSYQTMGYDPSGKVKNNWTYNMVGNPPVKGGTTVINAPVVPVTLQLLNKDGSVAYTYSPKPFILPTLESPVFQTAQYSSSPTPTQVTDAVMRAEFWSTMANDWHTTLNVSLKTSRMMAFPYGSYYYQLKGNGQCCEYVLIDYSEFGNLLFPATQDDATTPIGAAEHAGDITTKDISSFLFPNTYLYFNGDPNECCVLGYHTYDYEPGDAGNGNKERRYVVNYSSWISPGLFGSDFVDVTALSHEVAETFNDPFVASDGKHNVTPWWLSPNGNCQDNLEDGDVIEGLPHASYPVKMNGRTYHPQNEALLQWFEFEPTSSAIDGAYSYPNENVLTALSPVEHPGCQ